MKNKLRGKTILLLGVLAGCLLLAGGTAFLARQAWVSRQAIVTLISRGIAQEKTIPTQPIPQPTATSTAPAEHAALVISTQETSEESKTPRYSIEAQWPVLEWGGDPRVEAFNRDIQQIIDQEIRDFREETATIPDDPAFSESGSFLKISYTTTNASNGILAVLLRISFYTAGAAHPGSYSHAVNYDLREGGQLALSDLFEPGVNFLEPISAACIEDLKARGVLGWDEGALPREENYQVWNVTPDGLLITFDEYQVAPYAAGPQSVIIPYQVLGDIIDPQGPLAVFVHNTK